jgi:translation initiation factor IF-2
MVPAGPASGGSIGIGYPGRLGGGPGGDQSSTVGGGAGADGGGADGGGGGGGWSLGGWRGGSGAEPRARYWSAGSSGWDNGLSIH